MQWKDMVKRTAGVAGGGVAGLAQDALGTATTVQLAVGTVRLVQRLAAATDDRGCLCIATE